jgi:hypothetical protein
MFQSRWRKAENSHKLRLKSKKGAGEDESLTNQRDSTDNRSCHQIQQPLSEKIDICTGLSKKPSDVIEKNKQISNSP